VTPRRSSLDMAGFVLVTLGLGIVQSSIATAQIAFGLAAIAWVAVMAAARRFTSVPHFFVPLVVYAGLTLVSAALSVDPAASFVDSRQLLLLLIVPVVAEFVRGDRTRIVVDVIIALGAAGAMYGIVQVTWLDWGGLSKRPDGPLSHYMTYSGVLMLVACAAVARLLFDRREWLWPAVAVPALIVALGFTLARNAWAGVFVAVACLLALKNWKLVIVAPVAAILLYLVAPADIKARASSIFDMNDPTNRDRRAMMVVGTGMVRDHPLFGVGPEMVQREYARYRPANYVNPVNPHLHNVPMQIAAERGLLALGAWIWFVVAALVEHARAFRRGSHPAVAATGLAAVIAMLTAGMLEYNFGDSEFLMLFLGLITLPYAAGTGRAEAASVRARPTRPMPVERETA
jgi:O-antigen ligase